MKLAAQFWDRAIQLRPNFPEVNFMLGEALRKNRRSEAAIEVLPARLGQDATKFVYYARLGGAYLQLGQLDRCARGFGRALQRFHACPRPTHFVGISCTCQG